MSFNLPTIPQQVKTPATWTRPSDWPVITPATDEHKFLICDVGLSQSTNVFGFQIQYSAGTASAYIDWGDGSSITTLTGPGALLYATHSYVPGTGTPCSRGYTTWSVRVWCDAPSTFLYAQPNLYTTTSGAAANQVPTSGIVPVLEIYWGDSSNPNTNVLINLTYTTTYMYSLLEYVKFPAVLGAGGNPSLSGYYKNLTALQKVVLPTSFGPAVDISSLFSGCSKLTGDLVFVSPTSFTTIASAFQGCQQLNSVKILNSNLITTASGAFNSCVNLSSVEFGDMSRCLIFSNLFLNCFNLQSFKMGAWYNNTSTTQYTFTLALDNMFNNCYNLQYVSWGNQIGATPLAGGASGVGSLGGQVSASSMFASCFSLTNVVLPVFYNSYVTGNLTTAAWTTTTLMFQNCYNLTSVIFTKGSTSNDLTWQWPRISGTALSMFSACYMLPSISIPDLYGSAQSLFTNCASLKSFDGTTCLTNITNFNNAFSFCYQLQSITMPSTMNLFTDMTSAFNGCSSLRSIVLPTMTSLITAPTIFQNCFGLQSIVFPAALNAVTNFTQVCSSCYTLSSLTLPTSMSACITWTSAFASCYSLKTLVLPATISASANAFAGLCNLCISLESITFPTTQLTTAPTISTFLNNCNALKTITNLDKMGANTGTTLNTTLSFTKVLNVSTWSFSQRLALIQFGGTTTERNGMTSLRFLNTLGSQWTGTSPQIDISYTNIGYTALVQVFNDLAAQGTVTTKTINITSCTGAASLTAADRLIITSKGWTITG